MRDILLIVIVLPLASVALARPFVGILLFTWLGFLYPQSYTWGVGRDIPFSQIAAIATILGYLFSREAEEISLQQRVDLIAVPVGHIRVFQFVCHLSGSCCG